MIVAMMSFFDESPEWIRYCVRDLVHLGATAIVAVDGPYSLYPHNSTRSPRAQVNVLVAAAYQYGVRIHLHSTGEAWAENEVGKRQFMLDQALAVSSDGDWLAIWDCDYELVSAPTIPTIQRELQGTTRDVAVVSFTESSSDDGWHPMAMLLRAQDGIKMDGNHHTYLFPDGRRSQVLCRPVARAASMLDLSAIKVRHRVHDRTLDRRSRQTQYYHHRDSLGIET